MAKRDENQLKKMSRHGILNLLLEQTKRSEALAEENDILKKELEQAKRDAARAMDILASLEDINHKLNSGGGDRRCSIDNSELSARFDAFEERAIKILNSKENAHTPKNPPKSTKQKRTQNDVPAVTPQKLPTADDIISAVINKNK